MRYILGIITFLAGCSSEQDGDTNPPKDNKSNNTPILAVDVRMPALRADDGADCFEGDRVVLSGGDLVAMTDRIVVADVTDVRVVETFAEASSLEDGLSRCAAPAVRLTLRVEATVVENLHGTGETLSFTIGAEQLTAWTSHPRYRFNDRWLPDESAFQGEPLPQIQTTEELGWTGESGLQAGQRLLLLLNDNGGLTPTVFPIGEVSEDDVVDFQALDIPTACLSLPTAFQGGTLETIRASLQEPRVATDWESFEYPAETMSHCAESLSGPDHL